MSVDFPKKNILQEPNNTKGVKVWNDTLSQLLKLFLLEESNKEIFKLKTKQSLLDFTNSEIVEKLDRFFKKYFPDIYIHDVVGKLSLLENGDKNIKKMFSYFIDYCLLTIESLHLENLDNKYVDSLIKDVLLYFPDNKIYGNKININYQNINEIFNIKIVKGYLYFLLVNIFKNAIKHGDANKIDVFVKVDQNYLFFIIEDNGTGIKGNKEDIFKKGVSYGNSTGIGLANAKKYLGTFASTIYAENTEKGAKFTIKIPLLHS